MTLAIVESSSGAASASAMNDAIDLGASPAASACRRRPCRAACRRNWNRVTTPKLPPPPRIAQNRSGMRRRRRPAASSPSAVTSSAASRSSIVSPCLRARKPTPPPSVMPPIPTEPASPNPVARPCAAGRDRVLAGGEARLGPGRASPASISSAACPQVEHDPAVAHAVAGAAVAAAADGELQPVVARRARPRVRRRPRSRRGRSRAGRRSTPPRNTVRALS